MPVSERKTPINKFPLRMMPSVRRSAELFSDKEGVSLNQFINVAVAEKLAHLEHEEWLHNRKPIDSASIARSLAFLDRKGTGQPEPGDKLPEGYVSVRKSSSPKR
jgi:hypothetical protein